MTARPPHATSVHRIQRLRRKLLDWYRVHARDLPWRQSKDPYSVWISEVMLQQTQVQTVIPYFLKFLKEFPDIQSLAAAQSPHLLRVWAGLGYYSRARNLQRAARQILEEHRGRFPTRYKEVLALPGIGRYTAGAILSIAFDQAIPVLDGNVIRALGRLFHVCGDPRSTALQKQLWELAGQLVPEESPGDFNQAVMELGATVCTPRQPRCLLCPWKAECAARKAGVQESVPEKGKTRVGVRVLRAAAVLQHRGRFLIVRRSDENLLRDFWEFPGGEFPNRRLLRSSLAKRIKAEFGLDVLIGAPLATIKHVITTRRIELQVFHASLSCSTRPGSNGRVTRWIRLEDAADYPFASASRQILNALGQRSPDNSV